MTPGILPPKSSIAEVISKQRSELTIVFSDPAGAWIVQFLTLAAASTIAWNGFGPELTVIPFMSDELRLFVPSNEILVGAGCCGTWQIWYQSASRYIDYLLLQLRHYHFGLL